MWIWVPCISVSLQIWYTCNKLQRSRSRALWFQQSRKHFAEFDDKNGINCKTRNIVEFAKMWIQFIKIQNPDFYTFFFYENILTSHINGLLWVILQHLVWKIKRLLHHFGDFFLGKVFNNFTLTQCSVQLDTLSDDKMCLNRKTQNSEKLKRKSCNLSKI